MKIKIDLLREYIQLLSEKGDTGSILDAEEAAAKAKYEAAQLKLKQWDIEAGKKQAFLDAAQKMGISPTGDAARKKLKSQPQFNYDTKVLQAQRKTLADEVEKTRIAYASYAPLEAGPVTKDEKTKSNATLPDESTPVFAEISTIRPNQLNDWHDKRWEHAITKLGPIFSKTKGEDDKTGTGPGEVQLSKIFGAAVQGGGTSFDLVTKDGRQWEVKGLESKSSTVRPGTEGRRAFQRTKRHLDNIMRQMKNFVAIVKKTDLIKSLDDKEQTALSYVIDFIDNDFEEIVSKGEVTFERRKSMRAALKAISMLKSMWQDQGNSEEVNTNIGLGGKDVHVDKVTYIDVAKKIEKATDVKVLEGFQGKELAIATLKDPAFENVSEFLNEWYESVDINVVFEQVDGVFIVTPQGFYLVPKSTFKNAFKFVKVSQGSPRFAYTYMGGAGSEE